LNKLSFEHRGDIQVLKIGHYYRVGVASCIPTMNSAIGLAECNEYSTRSSTAVV